MRGILMLPPVFFVPMEVTYKKSPDLRGLYKSIGNPFKKTRPSPFHEAAPAMKSWPSCCRRQRALIFTPKFGEDETILTSIFFRWVGSTTNQYGNDWFLLWPWRILGGCCTQQYEATHPAAAEMWKFRFPGPTPQYPRRWECLCFGIRQFGWF